LQAQADKQRKKQADELLKSEHKTDDYL